MGDDRPHDPADDGMGGGRGQPIVPGYQIPDDGADNSGQDHHLRDVRRVHDSFADGGGNLGGDHGTGKVENSGHENRRPDGKCPGGDTGGNGIGGVVEAIDEIENQGSRDNE